MESVAAGEGQLRAIEVVVPNPRRPSAGERGIKKELYFRLRDLFSLQPDLVFYDLT